MSALGSTSILLPATVVYTLMQPSCMMSSVSPPIWFASMPYRTENHISVTNFE